MAATVRLTPVAGATAAVQVVAIVAVMRRSLAAVTGTVPAAPQG
ncbi:MAG: hypothetical protein JWL64_1673 [Frankiales bacterium]|nr:hypothetical protein [Frankiales bacterium]